MRYIKAPFNFVAVSNKVYFPSWADQISHDIPFSDGLSGQLKIEIEAKTPIFVRDSIDTERFCHIKDKDNNNRYFIPGTSLKGTIRSVLEILSFAKMDKINDHKYAIRDLHNPGVYNLMRDSVHIRCGWLSLKEDENGKETGSIRDCGTPWRISHEQLDIKFETSFVNIFKDGDTADFHKDSNKTARFKYDLMISKTTLTDKFKATTNKYGKQLCDFNASGKPGTIVFTGQAGPRKTNGRPSGKFYEFVFIEPSGTSNNIEVDAKIWEEFKFHYFDYDIKNISADWKWRKSQLKKGKEIPVFFRLNLSDETKVKDLGLAYLYKMPYKYSVKELLPEKHKLPFFQPDMAECIFGSANETGALKGRVQFSTARAMNTVTEGNRLTTILGTPKASYYPVYIKQNGVNGYVERDTNGRPVYKTYMDANAELAGRKRYPVRESVLHPLPPGTQGMNVSFTPLDTGAKFIAKINYFNLRPAELGALLSALTFHNNASDCYHGIGMAKPYGFGRISLKITDGINEKALKKYLEEFESEMNAYMQVDQPGFQWCQSAQIKEFIAMAKVQRVEDERRLAYMDLPEFAKAKNTLNGFCLEDYSSLSGDTNGVSTLLTNTVISGEKKDRAEQMNKQIQKKINSSANEEELRRQKAAEKKRLEEAEREKKKQEAAEKVRREALEEEKKTEQKKLEELRLKQEAIQKEIEKRRREEQAERDKRNEELKKTGLKPLIQDAARFEKAKKIVDLYRKRTEVDLLNDKDIDSLLEKARYWYLSTPDKNKEKRWKPVKGPDWKKIAAWIGDERAKKWYDDLTGEKNDE